MRTKQCIYGVKAHQARGKKKRLESSRPISKTHIGLELLSHHSVVEIEPLEGYYLTSEGKLALDYG